MNTNNINKLEGQVAWALLTIWLPKLFYVSLRYEMLGNFILSDLPISIHVMTVVIIFQTATVAAEVKASYI